MASARSLLPEAELLEVLGRAFVNLHERAAARQGKLRWADKNPENVLYPNQWQQLLSDQWLMIHVVRNPLDTLASIKEIKFSLAIPTQLPERIEFYRRYLEAGLEYGKQNPDRYHCVLYEQLVQSPQDSLQSMMEWLGETFEPGQLQFNALPQEGGLEDPKIANTSEIHAQSNGRWQAILSPEEAQVIWRETHDLWALFDSEGHYDKVIRISEVFKKN